MSVRRQIPSLCKLHSIYEEILQEFLDETDVNFYSHRIICDISQSQHRMVRVSKGSNKKICAIKFFQFCVLKTQQCCILQGGVNVPKKLSSLVNSLRDFHISYYKVSKCLQVPIPNFQNWDWIYQIKRQSLCSLL